MDLGINHKDTRVSMARKYLFILFLDVLLSANVSFGIEEERARAFVGQDLHLSGDKLISYQLSTVEHCLVLPEGFSMSIGANHFSSESAVVLLESVARRFRGRTRVDYKAKVYMRGDISVQKGRGVKTTDLGRIELEEGGALVVWFEVSGEVFVTAAEREIAEPGGMELYRRAVESFGLILTGPKFVVKPDALVPELPTEKKVPEKPAKKPGVLEPIKEVIEPKKRYPKRQERRLGALKEPAEPEVKFRYPVNISPAGEAALKIESSAASDGTDIATVSGGRLYLWQKQDERGGLLELLADNAVIFYSAKELQTDKESRRSDSFEDVLSMGAVRAVYLSGDILMTEGVRTIRSDELYYDFHSKKALAVNAVMRNFDTKRGIPIYVRADQLEQLAENKFAAEGATLTSSEFELPQISLTASKVIITDTTTLDAKRGRVSDDSYDAQMYDIRMKYYDSTVFYWPYVRTNLQKPDTALKSVHAGYDNTWGMTVETRWYLSKLLGLREPEGVDSTYAFDYYGKRGFGTGVKIDYQRDNYFGRLIGYIIDDSGEDKLGRHSSRRGLGRGNEVRGRLFWLQRTFLPYNWQLTTGVGYASDEHFIEQYYRSEFNVGAGQETYVHLKRIEDNWGLSLLGLGRINDFADELEEMPSVEFHLVGQSLFDDNFTLYSDTQVSRLRQKIGKDHSVAIDKEWFSFVSHRSELDMPVRVDSFKIVPFVAATVGYDDRSGFTRTLVDGSGSGSFGEDTIWIGEAGIRAATQYWKVYPGVKSRLWDLNGLRHIIKPHLTAVLYEQSDLVVEQRDVLNVGISQRLQTKRLRRGALGGGLDELSRGAEEYETVDWMRFNIDFIWLNKTEDAVSAGTDRLIWNRPAVGLGVLSSPEIYNGSLITGLGRFEMFGPRRNYIGADYVWRLSDTAAVLSDMNYDMQSGVVQQFNIGYSRLFWPNLQIYLGSRYLRRVQVLGENGSNAFTFAATYVLDPRYTLIFSQQYDFDYGDNVRNDITLIRRYHRMYCGFTYSADESLSEHMIVFSIWPQGVPEMAMGPRRFMRIGGSAGY